MIELLIENIEFLIKHDRSLREKLKKNTEGLIELEVFPSKNGQPIVQVVQEQRSYSIHSKYDPLKEAEKLLRKYDDQLSSKKNVIFYGIGFGFHIEAITKAYPEKKYHFYEPSVDIFRKLLANRQLSEIIKCSNFSITLEENERSAKIFVNNTASNLDGEVVLIPLPSYENIFAEKYNQFLIEYKNNLLIKKSNIVTNIAFQNRWTLNSLKNVPYTINSPNFLVENNVLNNKPAIIVSAGPSLTDEIENLRKIKNQGKAYIFAVGSANKVLIKNNIYPDAVCSYDPQSHNHKVFSEIIDLNLKEIPMIFGTTVGYETLVNYQGKKFHMVISQDSVTPYLLRGNKEPLPIIYDSPSIAVVTLQMLHNLGASPIILVGQNLAYRKEEFYSKGIEYESRTQKVTTKDFENSLKVKNVYGEEIVTNTGFNNMRLAMESYIKAYGRDDIINTTKDGAHIEGTSYISLVEVIENRLEDKVVDNQWADKVKYFYNKEDIILNYQNLLFAYEKQKKNLANLIAIFDEIEKEQSSSDRKLEKLFLGMDKEIKKLEKNDFYNIFIKPSMRVQREQLVKVSREIKSSNDTSMKAQMILKSFGNYINEVNKNTELYVDELLQLTHLIGR